MIEYSIEDWLHSQFDSVKPAGTDELTVCCPFCVHDTRYHMYVSIVKPVAHCYKCGWSGGYVRLIREVLGTDSYAEAYRQLTNPTNDIRNFQSVLEQLRQRKQEPAKLTYMPDWYAPFYPIQTSTPYHAGIVMRYALKRLGMEDIAHYGIGYCTDVDNPLALRLIIPIESGYYQARAINNAARQKYVNPTFPIEGRLFNAQALTHYKHVYIAEGAISAMAIGKASVATLGANGATAEQRKRLARSDVQQFTIIVEPEHIAQEQADAMAHYLNGYGKRIILRSYANGDPANSAIYEDRPYVALVKA